MAKRRMEISRIKKAINRGLIVFDALIRRSIRKNNDTKIVVIVFQQIFGDAIVIQNSLLEYEKVFPKSDGYCIRFIARASVLEFMKEDLQLPNEFIFEEVDFKRFLEDYSYYRKISNKYRSITDTIIVPGTSLSAEVFSCSVNARRRIGLTRCIDLKHPWLLALFAKMAYSETIVPDKESMMLQRHERLLHYLGDNNYKANIPVLIKKERIISGRYAVICPGSSKKEKCWPVERFAEVADYLLENYHLPIHLCGGIDEKEYESQLLKKSNHNQIITSHIGNTSFSDWSAIVQHADIVIGNDSATLHLAAAARVPSVCIAGVYDMYQFFPYKIDNIDAFEYSDYLPITIMRNMPCAWCRTIGYDAGFGNGECTKRIQSGLCATCIDIITIDEVKKAIDILMGRTI